MKIILHIGMQKTGTTSLQGWFSDNSELMERSCWRCINTPLQIVRINEQVYDSDWVVDQANKAQADGMDALIFSAEGISTYSADHIADIVQLFPDDQVEIVLCLRHWSGFLPSRWSQCCFWGDTQSFPKYLSELERLDGSHMDANYVKVINRAVYSGADRLSIISYNNALEGEGLLLAFLRATQFPKPDLIETRLNRYNQRQGLELIEIARLFSGVRSENEGRSKNAMFDSHLTETALSASFHHVRHVRHLLKTKPELMRDIEALLAVQRMPDWQSHMADSIAKWESRTEAAAAPYLINPVDGKLFNQVEQKEQSFSYLDIDDLPTTLKRTMYETLMNAMEKVPSQ